MLSPGSYRPQEVVTWPFTAWKDSEHAIITGRLKASAEATPNGV